MEANTYLVIFLVLLISNFDDEKVKKKSRSPNLSHQKLSLGAFIKENQVFSGYSSLYFGS